jgi:hypothetical protein
MKRRVARNKAQYGKDNLQTALNNLLWKIIMDKGGVINMSRYEMDQIPTNAALKATFDSATNKLIVMAALRVNQDGIINEAGT